MSRSTEYEAKTENLLKPIAEQLNVSIYDIEYVKEGSDFFLRAYIDKEGGVSLNDCEAVSRALSDALDEDDFIDDAYILEVSSPGLGRQLKKDKHLSKSISEDVELKTYKPIELPGEKPTKDFTGRLKRFDRDNIIIEKDGAEVVFKRSDIATIRLTFDF